MQPTTIGWVATAALVVGALVRLLKSDALNATLTNLGLAPIPKRWLPWIALFLGAASSVLDNVVEGTPMPEALVKGILSAFTAIAGHQLVIESARDGREIAVKKAPPAPLTAFVMAAFVTFVGCAAFQKAAPYMPSPDKIACVINEAEHGNDNPLAVVLKCGLDKSALDFVEHLLLGHKKAKAMRAAELARDAGAP